MSNIKLVQAEKEGLALESQHCGLGFPAAVAAALAANYKVIVAEPAIATVTIPVTDGRPHPAAMMLGLVSTTDAETNVYPLGTLEFSEGPDEGALWVSNVEGVIRISYTDMAAVEEIKAQDGLDGHMASFAFDEEDLDEVLRLLGTDLTDESNYFDYEA